MLLQVHADCSVSVIHQLDRNFAKMVAGASNSFTRGLLGLN